MGYRPCRDNRRTIRGLLVSVDGEGHVFAGQIGHKQGRPERPILTCMFVAPGVGLEPTTCGLTDHRNLSRTSCWTASARGFNDVCLTGGSVSVWLRAFCAMKCATNPVGSKDTTCTPRRLNIGVFSRLWEDAPTTGTLLR